MNIVCSIAFVGNGGFTFNVCFCVLFDSVFIYFQCLKQDPSCRESDYRAYWLARNRSILDSLIYERSSIICLQVCFCLTPTFFGKINIFL